jgi:DnaJ-class molecular chaperone
MPRRPHPIPITSAPASALPMVAPGSAQATCQTCGGAGLTQALTLCASCAGSGSWRLRDLLRCGRCGGRMRPEPFATADGAQELACLTCGARRYVQAAL